MSKALRNQTLTTLSLIFVSTFIVLGVVSLLTNNFYILLISAIIVYLAEMFIRGSYRIIVKNYVSKYTTSTIRSKLMSIYYLAEHFGTATLLFLTSSLLDSMEIGLIYTLSGFVLSIALIIVLNYMEPRIGLDPESYGTLDRMDLQEKEKKKNIKTK